ncbi:MULTISPECIES: phage tail fiber protein [unclassified Bradyrhizobium]
MSKGDTFENDLLKLIFNGTAIANLADNAASSPLTSLYFAMHTADPGEGGSQTTSEVAYTSYARVAVARNSTGFMVTGNSVSPVNDINFPTATGGSATATFFSIGTAASGTGKILYSGTLSPAISISTGVPPVITNSTTITED